MVSLYNIERNKTYKKQIIQKVSYHPRDSALENRINAEKSDKKHVKKALMYGDGSMVTITIVSFNCVLRKIVKKAV